MPCHPDRVRRLHESPDEAAALDREFAILRQRLADRDAAPPDDGITANVIEGDDHDDLWGV